LLSCLCRPAGKVPAGCAAAEKAPLEQEAYASVIEELARDPSRQGELACLSWAASAVQQHKANGMTMADAIRCAFDDPTIAPAHVTVAASEDIPCR
jgi:hypothetical protein